MQEYENKIDELDTLHKQRKVCLILETMNCSSGITVSLLCYKIIEICRNMKTSCRNYNSRKRFVTDESLLLYIYLYY